MTVHWTDDEMKEMATSTDSTIEDQVITEIKIPSFDIQHIKVKNGNGTSKITTNIFYISCNPKDTSL